MRRPIPAPRRRAIRDIITWNALEAGLTPQDLIVQDRRRHVVIPRHRAMREAYALPGVSLSDLAEVFKRDHTTVLHGIRRAEEMEDRDA